MHISFKDMRTGITKHILPSFRGYKASYIKYDLIGGVIVASLSIPVAMGYAQIAGLPPVYGLYASILPVLGYILFASSRQTVFGIDAASSAITGSVLAAMGIAAGSQDAINAAPVLAFFAACFLILFAVLRVGRFVNFISATVMSGIITGIGLSIIISQIPKILGIKGGDTVIDNVSAIISGFSSISLLSLALGTASIVIILLGKKFLRKWPIALVVLILGTVVTAVFHLDQQGITIIGSIPSSLPTFSVPDFWNPDELSANLIGGFIIAVVVFAGSILPSISFAERGGYTLDNNQEIFATGFSNLTASFFGCPPTSASVSRTAASEQYRGKSQLVSVVSALIIVLVVLFLSALLYYMPQPVLSGIVFAALCGVLDVNVLLRLIRRSGSGVVLWIVSVLAVLFVGILFGVLVGVILSFIDVLIRVVSPPQAYLGRRASGQPGYIDLENEQAEPIAEVSIYRFSAPLVFANVEVFVKGVHKALKDDTKVLIIDASGINSIDINAADELRKLFKHLKRSGIQFYIAGAISHLRKDMDKLGLSSFLTPSHYTRTIEEAVSASVATGETEAERDARES